MRNRRTILTVAVVVVAAAGLFASTRQRLDSHWRDRNIVIDGDNGDWAGPLQPIAEQHPILAAAANDGEFLYLVLSTSDAAVRRQILRQGLILWFDPSGGDKKHFGLKFPVVAGHPPTLVRPAPEILRVSRIHRTGSRFTVHKKTTRIISSPRWRPASR
jgi:hypothetical protein